MYLEKVHLIGAKDEVALSMKGGMLSHALLIATFVACLFTNKDVLNISYSRRFCYCGPHRRGKQSVCWDCSYSVQQTNQISEKWRTVVRYLFLYFVKLFHDYVGFTLFTKDINKYTLLTVCNSFVNSGFKNVVLNQELSSCCYCAVVIVVICWFFSSLILEGKILLGHLQLIGLTMLFSIGA